MLKSHLLNLVIFSLHTSVILAIIRFEGKKKMIRYGIKIFIQMVAGVILFSWLMYLF